MICQGCGITGSGFDRYMDIENGLVLHHLCADCYRSATDHMTEVLRIVRTPYAHFRGFLPVDAKPELRRDP